MWTVCATLAIMSHISTMHRDISHFWAAPMITAIRILYSSSVAWMIVASASGHGGFFAKFLNFAGFVHVNKLSYAIYLLNPVIISFVFGAKDHSTHVEPLTMVSASAAPRPRADVTDLLSIPDRHVRRRDGHRLQVRLRLLDHVRDALHEAVRAAVEAQLAAGATHAGERHTKRDSSEMISPRAPLFIRLL